MTIFVVEATVKHLYLASVWLSYLLADFQFPNKKDL